MNKANLTEFFDAIYHKQELYSFGPTEFSWKELKTLMLINGRRTVKEVTRVLGFEAEEIRPVIARLVKLGIIQTEDDVISVGLEDLFFDNHQSSPRAESSMYKLYQAA